MGALLTVAQVGGGRQIREQLTGCDYRCGQKMSNVPAPQKEPPSASKMGFPEESAGCKLHLVAGLVSVRVCTVRKRGKSVPRKAQSQKGPGVSRDKTRHGGQIVCGRE